jgi:hypothetical protein
MKVSEMDDRTQLFWLQPLLLKIERIDITFDKLSFRIDHSVIFALEKRETKNIGPQFF